MMHNNNNHVRKQSTLKTDHQYNYSINSVHLKKNRIEIPSSPSSTTSIEQNKNLTMKYNYDPHYIEIKRIKNAKTDYERLGISKTANNDDIQKAFRRLAFIVHPDKNNAPGSEEAFKILVKAKNSLLATVPSRSNWFSSKS
ncbi:unnamed protein product [Heterobilharzia americana]|nr:unnamed protein product [Heterobilharzia americana]